MAFFLIFLRFSLEEKMLLILMKSNSSVFSFMDFTFIVVSNKSLIIPRSQNGFPMLSLWSFTVLDFTGRFLIHFELISEECKMEIKVHFCIWVYNCSSTICWKDWLSLFHWIVFAPLLKSSFPYMHRFISGFYLLYWCIYLSFCNS